MSLPNLLNQHIQQAIQQLFDVSLEQLDYQQTKKDFEGDLTVVVFPLVKLLKSNPATIGNQIGEYLLKHTNLVTKFNVVGGFLNLVIHPDYYLKQFETAHQNPQFGFVTTPNKDAIMVEYASPNTNKPLHLGHVRNVLLGYAVAEILKAAGHPVYKTQIINDRGIHICKSMLAWQKFGVGETPETSGLKGDHLVGKYYVAFDKAYKAEVSNLLATGLSEEDAKKEAPILQEAQNMLRLWEANDQAVVSLWKTMNAWVYDGFNKTYDTIGVNFDQNYYESETYLLGKEVVEFGLQKGIFEQDPDGSVWIDLTQDGLDRKIVLRSDGTAVYMTQDIGTAIQRVKDFPDINGLVYTVGNEQDYHFKVLFLILQKLGFAWAKNLYHLSYGMVELPSGKMKSREGTVVDADELMEDMFKTAQQISEELGKLDDHNAQEKNKLYKTIGLGALKYFILKVDPKKQMLFNPKESVDFNGNTGPFIQYTHARIQSILRKAQDDYTQNLAYPNQLDPKEKELVKLILQFPDIIQQAAKQYSPAILANYLYDVVKEYNSFYQTIAILGEDNPQNRVWRIQLSATTAKVIKNATQLLGIEVPNRM